MGERYTSSPSEPTKVALHRNGAVEKDFRRATEEATRKVAANVDTFLEIALTGTRDGQLLELTLSDLYVEKGEPQKLLLEVSPDVLSPLYSNSGTYFIANWH